MLKPLRPVRDGRRRASVRATHRADAGGAAVTPVVRESDVDSAAPPELSVVRMAIGTGVTAVWYLSIPLMDPEARVRPLILLAAVAAAVLVGVAVAWLQGPEAAKPRRVRPGVAAARAGMAGLVGIGMALSRVVPADVVPWFVLLGSVLMAWTGGQAWQKERNKLRPSQD